MKKLQLNKPYRDLLKSDYALRSAIGLDISANERTIQRWAAANSHKLTTDHFIKSLKRHAKLSKEAVPVSEVEIAIEA